MGVIIRENHKTINLISSGHIDYYNRNDSEAVIFMGMLLNLH